MPSTSASAAGPRLTKKGVPYKQRVLKPNVGAALAIEVRDLFGGVRPAARALGVPVPTFFNWLQFGVPRWREAQVRAALVEFAVLEDLTPPFPKVKP